MAEQPLHADRIKVSLLITNEDSTPLTLHLEPWGDEHQIPPSVTLRIEFIARSLQPIPVSYSQGSITVQGWEGCVAYVWCDGQLLS